MASADVATAKAKATLSLTSLSCRLAPQCVEHLALIRVETSQGKEEGPAQWPGPGLQNVTLPRLRPIPVVNLFFGLILGYAVTLLDLALELIAATVDSSEVISQ